MSLPSATTPDNCEILTLEDEDVYCRHCSVVEIEPGDVYCLDCLDELCQTLYQSY